MILIRAMVIISPVELNHVVVFCFDFNYYNIIQVYFSLSAHLKKSSPFATEKKLENQHMSKTLTQAIYSISSKTIFTSASITSISVCTSSIW